MRSFRERTKTQAVFVCLPLTIYLTPVFVLLILRTTVALSDLQRRGPTSAFAIWSKFSDRMATTQQRVAAVINYTLEYCQPWHSAGTGVFDLIAAGMMLAAGCGTARAHTCEQTFRHHVRFGTSRGDGDGVTSVLLLRALDLLRAGELHTLRVTDPSVAKFILSAMVQREENIAGDVEGKAQRVFAPLRVVEWGGGVDHAEAAFALLERYAANITELHCPLQRQCDAADSLLARCIRLEVLMNAHNHASSTWCTRCGEWTCPLSRWQPSLLRFRACTHSTCLHSKS
jgi:hypothetical protein